MRKPTSLLFEKPTSLLPQPVAAALPWPPTNKTAPLQSLLPAKKPLPFLPDTKNVTTLDDVVATALAVEDHAARSAAAVKAAPDPKHVAKWKAAELFDLKKGERCFGYSVALSLAMTGPCPTAPPTNKIKPERHRCHPRAVADAAGEDVRAAVAAAGDPAATVVVERYGCVNSVLTAQLYVGARWGTLQAAVPPLAAGVGAGGTAAAAALPTAAARVAACGSGAITSPSSLAVDTSFLVNVALAPSTTSGYPALYPAGIYPVGPSSVMASPTVGGAQYSIVADTASDLISVPCNTPYSASLCTAANAPAAAAALAASYAPPAAVTMGAAACAASTTTDCFGYLTDPSLPVQQPACWFSQRLTGGTYDNSPAGFYTTGTPLAFSTKQTCQSPPSLAFGGTIACGLNFRQCSASGACKQALAQCTPDWSASSAAGAPGCIYEPDGTPYATELGWQFAIPSSAAPLASYNAVPSQVLRAGLIAQRKLSFCWTQPSTAYNCTAINSPQPVPSYNVLGPARPRAIKAGAGALGTAPLSCLAANDTANTTTDASVQKFWAQLATVTVQPPANLAQEVAPQPVTGLASNPAAAALLDTGAYTQQMVPPPVFNVYYNMSINGLAKASALALDQGFSTGIEGCNTSPNYPNTKYCQGSILNTTLSCRKIRLLSAANVANRAIAAQILQDSWPSSLDVSFAGGTGPPASMPGAFVRYYCNATTGSMPPPGDDCVVVGCSYVNSYDYAWFAGPFFYRNSIPPPGGPPPSPGGTWTEFDMSAPPPGAAAPACGTLTYATEPVDCAY